MTVQSEEIRPVLIFFLLLQRTYIESIAASGIKG